MPIETDGKLLDRLSIAIASSDTYFSPKGFKSSILGVDSVENSDAEKSGHSPSDDPETNSNYDNAKYKRKPHSIWFYYKRVNTDGSILLREYIVKENSPISNGQMKSKVRDLALNARFPLRDQNPRPTGNNNFTKIEIDRICYFVIFVDEQNWEFQKDSQGNPIVLFKQTDPDNKPCRPNYSFFKAEAFKTNMGGGDIRESLAMVNYLKRNAVGDELIAAPVDDHKHRWFFDYPQRVRFMLPDTTDDEGNSMSQSSEQSKLTVMIDPGGNNLGPPKDP